MEIFDILQREWPIGGTHKEPGLISLGWVTVTHVNKSWRTLAISMTTLWAKDICAIYQRHAVQEFLRRSGRAPIVLDLERWERSACSTIALFDHWDGSSTLEDLTPLITSREIVQRASEIRAHVFPIQQPGYSPYIPCTPSHHLTGIDIFITNETPSMQGFDAPGLTLLHLWSHAIKPSEAPLPFDTLLGIIRRSPRLKELHLHYAVRSPIRPVEQAVDDINNRLCLRELVISSFDDAVAATFMEHLIKTRPDLVKFTMNAVEDLIATHAKFKTLILEPTCQLTVADPWKRWFTGNRVKYGPHLSAEIYTASATLVYRQPVERATWDWPTFVRVLDPLTITEVCIAGMIREGYETSQSGRTDLPSLMGRLNHVEHLALGPGVDVDLPMHLPGLDGLRTLTLMCRSQPITHRLSDWVVLRSGTLKNLEITLKGGLRVHEAAVEPESIQMDRDVLSILRKICHVEDDRKRI